MSIVLLDDLNNRVSDEVVEHVVGRHSAWEKLKSKIKNYRIT